jgi:hypothetical protein
MSFRIYTFSPSSAVATGGTMAFVLGSAVELGQVKLEGAHVLFAEGLGAQFNFPNDFTISFSGSTATVTYNGTTTIPAGTVVKLQLETPGENNYLTQPQPLTVRDYLGNIRSVQANLVRVLLGAPIAATATNIVNAVARTGTNTLTTYAPAFVQDVPRNLQLTSSNAGDTTQTVIVRGTDEFGVAMSETFSLNGTSVIAGNKAFKTVISDQVSATMVGNLSVGSNTALGLPFFIPGGTGAGAGYILKEAQTGTTPTAGTVKGGDLTKATATTGDVRGTYVPNSAADGTKIYELFISGADVSFRGVPQFTS